MSTFWENQKWESDTMNNFGVLNHTKTETP